MSCLIEKKSHFRTILLKYYRPPVNSGKEIQVKEGEIYLRVKYECSCSNGHETYSSASDWRVTYLL